MAIKIEDIEIRRLGLDDIDQMIFHRLNYLAEIQGSRDESVVENLRVELISFFRAGILNGSAIVLVALYNGVPVSYGALLLRKIPGDFNCSVYTEGDVLNMYTVPEARRMGLSTILLDKLLVEARNAGLSKVSLHTTRAGEGLYRSAGFMEPEFLYLEKVL